ncbi:hypothetical protein JOQ06_009608 [Pogonophryne albipinna]|uniref:Transcription initiation factor TFIID component TAF4 C-terminal domain-containing protein n=1 Tax=Pogonophryne albipinna TaxID=1090488 RepID=A0AAD6BPD1_9TELE|nr:hypothetical protein JOQ06_009608 [Pogonophryne albipinna]
MWRASAGQSVKVAQQDDGADDWETDPDFENDVSEREQRWGAKTVEGSGHQESIDINRLREAVSTEHTSLRKKEQDTEPKASDGYGGKFGVQQGPHGQGERESKDRTSAVGHDYQSKLSKHCSQTDTSKGFGGKFGVQADRVDQSAVGFEYTGKTEKHASQKGDFFQFDERLAVAQPGRSSKKFGVTEVPDGAVTFISHAAQSRLRTVVEKVSCIAQQRLDSCKDEEGYEQSADVRSQLRFFEQLERMEKQRKDEQEREILLKAAKAPGLGAPLSGRSEGGDAWGEQVMPVAALPFVNSPSSRSRQEDPEQARLKQKAKEVSCSGDHYP